MPVQRGNKTPRHPFFFVTLAVIALDQASKAWMVRVLSGVLTQPIIPHVFHLTLVHNTGVAFGLLKGCGLLVTLGTLVIIVVLCWSRLFTFSAGLILGGAISNLIDRLRVGAVIDFLDFRIWPVFNLADSCITIGAVLMAWQILKSK